LLSSRVSVRGVSPSSALPWRENETRSRRRREITRIIRMLCVDYTIACGPHIVIRTYPPQPPDPSSVGISRPSCHHCGLPCLPPCVRVCIILVRLPNDETRRGSRSTIRRPFSRSSTALPGGVHSVVGVCLRRTLIAPYLLSEGRRTPSFRPAALPLLRGCGPHGARLPRPYECYPSAVGSQRSFRRVSHCRARAGPEQTKLSIIVPDAAHLPPSCLQ